MKTGKYFTEEFNKQGCKVVGSEAFRSGELDFRAILGKIKGAKPEVLFIPTQQKELMVILRYMAKDFKPDVKYPESQVNQILRRYHEDTAALRRYMADNGLLKRERGIYWRE